MKTLLNNQDGMTLVEIVLAVVLLGIISVGFVTVFSSQYSNIITGSDITVESFDNQGQFEDIINTTKNKIQADEDLSGISEWSEENLNVLGTDITLNKIKHINPNLNNKEVTIYLSTLLAKEEGGTNLSVSNVFIDVSTDVNDLVADLSLSPVLTANHDDNSTQAAFYTNIYRWWKSEPGMDPSTLTFPDDYSLVPVPQDIESLDDLSNNVGSNTYVLLTVTPVDAHGYRGNTQISSNMVYVKGKDWRLVGHPWFDMDDNYEFEGTIDHQLIKDNILETLDASEPFQDPITPENDLDLTDGSLFIPMMIEPAISSKPGTEAISVDNDDVIDWYVEGDINIAKDINVINGSDIEIFSGAGSNGGSIILHPYPKLDSGKNPIITNGIVELLDEGVTLDTSGNILMETIGGGSIKFHQNSNIFADNIELNAKGSIDITESRVTANDRISLDTRQSPFIANSRTVSLDEVDFMSSIDSSEIHLNSREGIHFKGGSWSSKQTLFISDDEVLLLEKGDERVNNLGQLNLGNTGQIRFATSMLEDLTSLLRLRILKESNNEMKITSYNYLRNISFAGVHEDITFSMENMWRSIGKNNSNIEISASILSGPGNIEDLKYSFDGNNILKALPNTNTETGTTKIQLNFRDKYSAGEINGIAILNYSIDAEGDTIIDVEPELPIEKFVITFDTNGGSAIDPIEKEFGEAITTIPAPIREGYTFDGWYPSLPDRMPDHDLSVEAEWTPNEYNVTLDANGGTFSGAEEIIKTATYGQKYDFLETPNYPGFYHLGWYTEPEEGGDKIDSDDYYTITEDQILYSHWNAENIFIYFNDNGADSLEFDQKEVIYGPDQTYGDLPETERDGFTFEGWFTDDGTQVYSDSELEYPSTHTLYANWQSIDIPDFYIASFNDGGRNNFSIVFSNNIQSVSSDSLGDYLSISGNSIIFDSGNNFSTGDYSITVIDEYDQDLTFEVALSRFIFWYWWELA
jgi:uncharacterized repeat protein (TIGR02543 family)